MSSEGGAVARSSGGSTETGELDVPGTMLEGGVWELISKGLDAVLAGRSESNVLSEVTGARLLYDSCEWIDVFVLEAGEMTPMACSWSKQISNGSNKVFKRRRALLQFR